MMPTAASIWASIISRSLCSRQAVWSRIFPTGYRTILEILLIYRRIDGCTLLESTVHSCLALPGSRQAVRSRKPIASLLWIFYLFPLFNVVLLRHQVALSVIYLLSGFLILKRLGKSHFLFQFSLELFIMAAREVGE